MNQKSSQVLQTIYQQQNSRLLRFLTRVTSNPQDAEDIAQEAYYKVLKTTQPEQLEHPRSYLFQAAYNLALNSIRKQSHIENHAKSMKADAVDEADHPSPEKAVAAREEIDNVMKALEQLPEKVRRAFLLSRAQHKTYPEIAEELSVSVSSVEKYLIRALDHLRHQLPDQ